MIHFPCLSYNNTVTTPIPLAEDRLMIPQSYGHILIPPQKVRRNPFPAPFSLKINAPSLITNLRKLSFLSVSNRQSRQFTHMSFLYFVQIYRAFILPKGYRTLAERGVLDINNENREYVAITYSLKPTLV